MHLTELLQLEVDMGELVGPKSSHLPKCMPLLVAKYKSVRQRWNMAIDTS